MKINLEVILNSGKTFYLNGLEKFEKFEISNGFLKISFKESSTAHYEALKEFLSDKGVMFGHMDKDRYIDIPTEEIESVKNISFNN